MKTSLGSFVLKVFLIGLTANFLWLLNASVIAADSSSADKIISDFEDGTLQGWSGEMTVFSGGANGSVYAGQIQTPANGSAGMQLAINSALLKDQDRLEFDLNLNGATLLPGDASAVVFEQAGWKWTSLSQYAQNGQSGWQHISIPLIDFQGLNTNDGVAFFSLRFWNYLPTQILVDNFALTANPISNELTAPTNLNGVAASSQQINLTWQGSSASYNIYANDQKVGTSTSTSFPLTGLLADTGYQLKVTSANANNESLPSNIITVKTLANSTIPPVNAGIYSDFENGLVGWTGDAQIVKGNDSVGNMRLSNSSNGSSEGYKIINSAILTNNSNLEFDLNLNGAALLLGDGSAIVFEQAGWKWVSLSQYVKNGQNGWQHIKIPLADFKELNTSAGVAYLKFRFWNNLPSNIDIDNIAFTSVSIDPPIPPVSTNLIPNSSVEENNNSLPVNWKTNTYEENTALFSYTEQGHTGNHSLMVEITDYTNGDSKWYYEPQSVEANKLFQFSVYYKSNVDSEIAAEILNADNTYSYITFGRASASPDKWSQFIGNFTTPATAKTITLFQSISSVGWLITDDYALTPLAANAQSFERGLVSITFDDGLRSVYDNGFPLMKKYDFAGTLYLVSDYLNTSNHMSTAQIQELQAAGFQIGSHTVDHPHLTTMTALQIDEELTKSKQELENLFGAVDTLATPFGEYNDVVLTEAAKYYSSQRSTDSGLNTRLNFTKQNIHAESLVATASISEIEQMIQAANENKTWLVLTFHDIDPASTDTYNNTPDRLEQILAYIKELNLPVVTIDQAIAEIASQI